MRIRRCWCLVLGLVIPLAAGAPEWPVRRARDLQVYRTARTLLQRAGAYVGSEPGLLSPSPVDGLVPRERKLALWGAWSSMLQAQTELDGLRQAWRDELFVKGRDHRAAAFSLTQAAFLCGYRHALEFIAQVETFPTSDLVLNEAVPELGIPAGTYDRYKFHFLNAAPATEFMALRSLERSFGPVDVSLRPAIAEDRARIWRLGKGQGPELTVKNALDTLRKAGSGAWFPVQKSVSEWMGDTKVRRRGRHLISSAQIEAARSCLSPGDILFERHEWYLSNLGLPGFWTHAALYVGTPQERRACFDDPQVRTWVQSEGIADGDFERLLRSRYPSAYGRAVTPREQGHPPRVLEAISEGVVFTSLEGTGESDSLAVIRPRLTPLEKARALLRAFHFSGRPYDFNFDFETDSSLVCSELVFKVYGPGEGLQGLRFPITEVMGRKISAPNAMVRQFDEQAGLPAAQCTFVLFLDGFEKEGRAVESDEASFRSSWRRPNWHVLVQSPPVAASP